MEVVMEVVMEIVMEVVMEVDRLEIKGHLHVRSLLLFLLPPLLTIV